MAVPAVRGVEQNGPDDWCLSVGGDDRNQQEDESKQCDGALHKISVDEFQCSEDYTVDRF
jgi:hypothetical protein